MLRAKQQSRCFKEAEKLLPHKLSHSHGAHHVCLLQRDGGGGGGGGGGGREMETSSSGPGLESWHHRAGHCRLNTLDVGRVRKLGFRKQGEVSVLTRGVALQSPRVGQ